MRPSWNGKPCHVGGNGGDPNLFLAVKQEHSRRQLDFRQQLQFRLSGRAMNTVALPDLTRIKTTRLPWDSASLRAVRMSEGVDTAFLLGRG